MKNAMIWARAATLIASQFAALFVIPFSLLVLASLALGARTSLHLGNVVIENQDAHQTLFLLIISAMVSLLALGVILREKELHRIHRVLLDTGEVRRGELSNRQSPSRWIAVTGIVVLIASLALVAYLGWSSYR